MMQRLRNALVAGLLAALGGTALAQDPAQTPEAEPILRAELASDTAVPGQPVVLRLTLLVPTWMPKPPELPSFDLPNLMVRLPSRSTTPVTEKIDGETWAGISRAYRLVPLVPGRIALAPQTVRVTYADPDGPEPRTATLTTPALSLTGTVPEGAEGLDPFVAGERFEITQEIEGEPGTLSPGDALVRRVRASIAGTAPIVIPPLIPPFSAEAVPPGLAAYPAEPEIDEKNERGKLSGTRLEAVTYVPAGGGSFTLPPIRIDWFDTAAGTLKSAEVPGIDLVVEGPPARAPKAPEDPVARLRTGLALGLALLAALLGWRFRGHAARIVATVAAAYRHSEHAAWRTLRRSLHARDLGSTLRALDRWWARVQPALQPLPAAITQALAAVGSDRYGKPGAPGGGDPAHWRALGDAIARQRAELRAGRAARRSHRLAPLNPGASAGEAPAPALRSAATGALVLLTATGWAGAPGAQDTPPRHIGSDACIACHAEQGAAWQGSHHQWAWTPPSPAHVLGDFSGATATFQGVTHRFFREGDDYRIETDGPDGAITTYRVEGVAGVAPLQQYLVATEPGRLQSHDVAWDTERRRWYHLYPDQDLQAGDGLHWTGPYKTWNARCAECHATGYEKAYDPRARRYRSRRAEIGVGCEACHGPGSAHRAWAEEGASPPPGLSPAGFTAAFGPADPEAEIQQCAGCHSRREPLEGGNPLPGTPFHDSYRLALLRPGLYHADGAILDEVYVYGSFLQSRMYAQGVRCTDCHEPHSARLKADANAVCTQCHSPAGNERFPMLRPALYDSPEHHFHPDGTPGAACVSCHMIERTYMQVDPRRDHSFRVPRPDLGAETGAPDACTDCHADRDQSWAAGELARRFPESRHRGPHYAQILAKGRFDPTASADALLGLAEAEDAAAIVRATALELLRPVETAGVLDRAAGLLDAPDPLIRAAAVTLQRRAPAAERARRLAPLLEDPARSVRSAAARALLDVPGGLLPRRAGLHMRRAATEWRLSLLAKADFPETHLAIGGSALVMRDLRAAEAAFAEAVRLDPNEVQGWSMLARIRNAAGNPAGAAEAIRRGLDANPTAYELLLLGDPAAR